MGKVFQALVFAFFFLFSVSFVSAQPLTNIYIFDEGLIIVDNPQILLKQNQNYQYNFFVYNKTNGELIDNSTINCIVYIANSSGDVLFFDEVDYFLEGYWGEDLNGSIFSELGIYGYGVQCQDDGVGGALSGLWEVTSSGRSVTISSGFVIFLLIFFFCSIGVFFFMKGFKTSQPLLRWTYMFGTYMFFLISMNLLTLTVADTSINPSLVSFMDSMTAYAFYVMWFYGAFLLIMWIITFFVTLKDRMQLKKMERYE